MTREARLGWRIPAIGIVAAVLLLFSLFLFTSHPGVWVLFIVIPCLLLLALVLLVFLIFRRTRRRAAELLLATVVFVGVTMLGLLYQQTLRPAVRWAFLSQQFKTQVLNQSNDPSGDFKHIEWDGWGGGPVGDWTAYVVFDPTNSLQTEAGHEHPGKIQGIPCDVLSIQRLEPRWYSVTLEMNEWWDQCRKQATAQGPE